MKNRLLFVVFLVVTVCAAQRPMLLKGQVVADIKDLKGINIVHLESKKEIVTSEEGLFSIYAKAGDTLVFTSVQLNEKRIVIEKEDFDYLPFLVKMNVKVVQLNEVVIEQSNITAESLGLVPKGLKTYTPAERKYYTATTGPVDALVNAINGKAKQRKKEIVIERHQRVKQQLEQQFDTAYFVNELKIPETYIEGFLVFASENQELANAVKRKNKPLLQFELVKLASEYIKKVSNEK